MTCVVAYVKYLKNAQETGNWGCFEEGKWVFVAFEEDQDCLFTLFNISCVLKCLPQIKILNKC